MVGSSRQLKHCPKYEQTIAGVEIKPTLLIRNLSVMVDGELTMTNHISHLTRTCGEEKPNYGNHPLTNQGAGAYIVVLTIATALLLVFHRINSTNLNPSSVLRPDLFLLLTPAYSRVHLSDLYRIYSIHPIWFFAAPAIVSINMLTTLISWYLQKITILSPLDWKTFLNWLLLITWN